MPRRFRLLDLSNNLSTVLGGMIPVGVFLASLIGSFHCLSMCGGLSFVATQGSRFTGATLYHVGRLIGYLSLGAVAGSFGKAVLGSTTYEWVNHLATITIALGLLFTGILMWRGHRLEVLGGSRSSFISSILKRVINHKNHYARAGFMGLLTALLPCGWLYSFVLAAIVAETPFAGAMVLLFFWLGTLPPLVIGREVYRAAISPLLQSAPKLSGGIFIALSVIALMLKYYPIDHSSHSHYIDEITGKNICGPAPEDSQLSKP